MHGPVQNAEDSILIDAARADAREIWLRCCDLGKTVMLYNVKGSLLWDEIRAKHRHREMGDDMGMVLLKTVRLSDQPDWINDIIERVQPYTLTRPERIAVLCSSVEYIVDNDIPGDIVECGVWRGGSMMAVALTLAHLGANRRLWLYDTFNGMTAPEAVDRTAHTGEAAVDIMARINENSTGWCRSKIEEVEANIRSVRDLKIDLKFMNFVVGGREFVAGTTNFVAGDVLETIPLVIPNRIALLRLDTDWYASTKHELMHLYPRISAGGVLIIDDYGHWLGARKAVDEWMAEERPGVCLTRVDYSCRMAVKP